MPVKFCKELHSSIPGFRNSGGLSAGGVACGLMVLWLILLSNSTAAQEAISSSLAGTAAAAAVQQQQQSPQYNYKYGDFRLLVIPSVSLEWNDNISLTKVDPQSDYIVTPMIGIQANYPIGKQNLLNLSVNFGYEKYFDHNQYSQFTINGSSGSGLSFDLVVKDVRINFHDRFQYAQLGAQQAAAAGPGTGTYGTFVNTVGLSSSWDMSRLTFTLGYDHQNTLATSSSFNQVNGASELFNAQAGYLVDSALTAGVQSTASLMTYQEDVLNNNNIYTFGVYADWKPGDFFTVHSGGGYTIYDPTSQPGDDQSQSLDTWYANLKLTHQATAHFTYTLGAGHEITPGFQSDAIEDWYVRPGASWNLIRNVSLATSLSYEHGDTLGAQVAGNDESRFDWYNGQVSLSYSPVKKVTMSLFYILTIRNSNASSDEYNQNLVGLQLSYTP